MQRTELKKRGFLPVANAVTERKDYRKELWTQVAVAVARAENCRNPSAPANWANAALEEFDKTFGVTND